MGWVWYGMVWYGMVMVMVMVMGRVRWLIR